MSLKLSNIQKYIEKRIIIENGVPKWNEQSLNGDINFHELTSELIKEINEKVITRLKGNEDEKEVAYLILPYLTDVISDIPIEDFMGLMESKNPIILMLFEGILRTLEDIISYSEKSNEIKERQDILLSKMPKKVETVEEKIMRLTEEMDKEKDIKKKKIVFKELAELYSEIGE